VPLVILSFSNCRKAVGIRPRSLPVGTDGALSQISRVAGKLSTVNVNMAIFQHLTGI